MVEKLKQAINLSVEYSENEFETVDFGFEDEKIIVIVVGYWFYGEDFESALDKAIKFLTDKIEQERYYKEYQEEIEKEEEKERELQERIYWERQGATTGFVKCF